MTIKFSFLKIGITGGIGCGKSEVSKMLRTAGIPIIPADLLARNLMNADESIRARLKLEFGEDIYAGDGLLNRAKVAEIIFNDKFAKEKIEQIVHPKVIEYEHRLLDKIQQSGKFKIAAVEAALIFEAGSEKYLDYVIVVAASKETIIQRLKTRDGFNTEQIEKRLQSQMPLAEKINRADYVIQNNGSQKELENEVVKLIEWLKNKIE